jgi:hypothetical protein
MDSGILDVRDHFEKLGFVQIGSEANGETIWRLEVEGNCDKSLPISVETKQTDTWQFPRIEPSAVLNSTWKFFWMVAFASRSPRKCPSRKPRQPCPVSPCSI